MTAPSFGTYDPTRLQHICLACAERGVLSFAVVSGACATHRATVPPTAPPVTHEWITAQEVTS